MGIASSLLGKLGFPSLDSLSIDKLYADYFKTVSKEDEFICAVIRVCSDFNAIMPGKHCTIDQGTVKSFYKTWLEKPEAERKAALVNFMVENIKDDKAKSFAMISVGCAAPFGAIALKKSGERIPQLKKFRIDLVPNFVMVPTITLISVIGVRLVGLKELKPTKK